MGINQKYVGQFLLFAIVLGVGLYLNGILLLGEDFSFVPGDFGDYRFNLYLLEHNYQYLSGQISQYWNAPFFYPAADVISISDNLMGSSPIYALFRAFGYSTNSSFQYYFLAVQSLNFLTAFLFVRWLCKNPYAAVLAAFIFAFSIALQSQLTHAQTFPRYFIPLTLWAFIAFVQKPKVSYFFWTLFFLVCQFYCGVYLGFLLSAVLMIGFLLLWFWKRYRPEAFLREPRVLLKLGLCAITNLAFLLLLMVPYLKRALSSGSNSYADIVHSIPSLPSYFFSQGGSLFWDFLSHHGTGMKAWWDHQLFPGLLVLICFLIFIMQGWKNQRKGMASILSFTVALAVIYSLLFLRVGNISLYALVKLVPGFSSMRSMTRVINVQLIFFALGVAVVYVSMIKKFPRYEIAIFLLVFSGVVLDNYFKAERSYRIAKVDVEQRLIPLEEKVKSLPKGSVFAYEPESLEEDVILYQLDAMLVAQKYGLKTINGYSGNSPKGFDPYWHQPIPKNRTYYLSHFPTFKENVIVIK